MKLAEGIYAQFDEKGNAVAAEFSYGASDSAR